MKVRAIDIAVKTIVESVQNHERETIFVFHSDNGGSLKAYAGGVEGASLVFYKSEGLMIND